MDGLAGPGVEILAHAVPLDLLHTRTGPQRNPSYQKVHEGAGPGPLPPRTHFKLRRRRRVLISSNTRGPCPAGTITAIGSVEDVAPSGANLPGTTR
jgi:hypothetical protein